MRTRRRVVVLGSAGAGKSLLARRISLRTGLPVIHLDRVFWRKGWMPAPREDALRELGAAIRGADWILDGNFLAAGNQDPRFARADTVIFLDLSRTRCLWRVLKRLVRDRRRGRPDLPEGCREAFDVSLVRWVWSYPRADRPGVLQILRQLDRQLVEVHHFRSPRAVERFLDAL